MLFLRNIQAQRPDFLILHRSVKEEISQSLFLPLPVGEGRGEGISPHFPHYEYFFVRRVGAVFAGSSGQTCLGYRPFISFCTSR
ncbi:hypothetical protein BFX86_11265 [Enterobacter hormaechei]|uniref:Uncharacterized protein n=1 Tax=Enterobacter hormaechei TaxID=158836 RepID=A0AAE7YTQ8_9ENTR|nr:hypothetical protein AM432_21730 [Enterobacter cloacae complex sp.]ATW94477.1 hypothetical protein CU081_23600 [Enterobacter sp. CRENT-193]AVU49358.1 hypothetical protein AXJ76_04260 [Enterobacter cloacae]AWQ42182.1 hypothetical protein BET69_03990 [Enterobacter hormaechei]AWR70342.1 hypothetical protein CUN65_19190 [Enterobacter hormaechei subsp. xiangfangensis]RYA38343.1 hypothetical protein DD605_20535 [Enterobacter cloacae complex sp. 3DZ3S2B]RYA40732.1 hypothetical protein DD603_15720